MPLMWKRPPGSNCSPGKEGASQRAGRGGESLFSWLFLSRWWVLYFCSVGGVALAFAVPGVLIREPWGPAVLVLVMLLVAGYLVWGLLRRQNR